MALRLRGQDLTDEKLSGGRQMVTADQRDAVFESERSAGGLTLKTTATTRRFICAR